MNIYSIKDIKANRFMNMILFPNDEMAKRAISSVVNNSNSGSPLNEFPEDMQIFRIGTFDDHTGRIVYCEEFLWTALDLQVKGAPNA